MALIGELDRRIQIIEPTYSTGTSNEDKITGWELINTNSSVWASYRPSRGTVSVDQDRIVYTQTSVMTIRYRTDLNVRMRVVDENGQVYAIVSIAESGDRKRYTDLTVNIVDNEFWS
jgi:SPP1 family predicted phage head-tail adaptor